MFTAVLSCEFVARPLARPRFVRGQRSGETPKRRRPGLWDAARRELNAEGYSFLTNCHTVQSLFNPGESRHRCEDDIVCVGRGMHVVHSAFHDVDPASDEGNLATSTPSRSARSAVE